MKLMTKTWDTFIFYIFIGGFLFSLGALILTIYELNTWSSAYEANPISNFLFNEFGIFGGSAIIILINLFFVGIFLVFKKYSKMIENRPVNDFINLFGWSAFEAVGFSYLVNSFFDMSGNVLLAYSLANEGTGTALFSSNDLHAIFLLVFLIVFLLSLSIRLLLYVKSKTSTRIVKPKK